MANFNVNIISGSVELREGDLLLVNSESTINVRTELNRKENITNRAYTLNAESTNDQYPTAKTVYDFVSSSVAEVPKVEEVWVRGKGSGSTVLSGSVNASRATGQFSIANVYGANASGDYAHAEGWYAKASGESSHAEGHLTLASGNYSHAEGFSTTSSNKYSHAEGSGSTASGESSHAEGCYTSASGTGSHAEGFKTRASGEYSHAEGNRTVASGQYSHAEGTGSVASGTGSHAEGTGSVASGNCSHAEGYYTTASGHYSHAEGCGTIASGSYSHAEGYGTIASGYYSHAEGNSTIASGQYSHAEGNYTRASGKYSHAEGYYTTASVDYSHAEGNRTVASGQYSHAEGSGSKASGNCSHAEGYHTTASGFYSHAEGNLAVASNTYEHAQGQYNATASNQIFSVGAGDIESRRKNAISIITGSNPSASIYIYGIDSYVGNNPVPGTNDLASVIAKISASAVPADLTGLFASASYDSGSKKIYFYDNNGTASGEVDATAFIKDGMVNTVTIDTGSNQMIITFNTDAGKEDIALDLTQIFNPNNYYTKTEVNTISSSLSASVAGKQDYFADVENTEDGVSLGVPGTGEYTFRVRTNDGEEWASIIGIDPYVVSILAGDFRTASAELSLVTEEENSPHVDLLLLDQRTSQRAFYQMGVDGIDLNQKQVHSLADPTSSQDAATKNYVDTVISNIPSVDTSSLVKNNQTGSWASASAWLGENSGSLLTESALILHLDPDYWEEMYVSNSNSPWVLIGEVRLQETNSLELLIAAEAASRPVFLSSMFGETGSGLGILSYYPLVSHQDDEWVFGPNIPGRQNLYVPQIISIRYRSDPNTGDWNGNYDANMFEYYPLVPADLIATSIWVRGEGSGSAVLSGSSDIATGQFAVAEGQHTTASGQYSHTEGGASIASGAYSHAEGFGTIADGDYSHAEGEQSIASGFGSHAEGVATLASNYYEHAQGRYNATASRQIFSVGVGDRPSRRKNAISIITGSNPSASIYVYGVGSYNGTNPEPGVNDIATVISNISASSGGGGGITAETDPVYLADSASLKASASLAQSAIQPAATSSWAAAATWITANSASALAVSPASVTASINAAIGGITASHHTHSNKAVLDGITAAKTASWDNKLSSESDPIYLADSASLKNAATWLGSNSASLLTSESDPVYLADSASLKASASLAKTAIQPAATSSWATAATWVTNNSSSVHTHDNKTVLDGITAAKTASWEASGTLAKNLTAISASLIASGTLAKNVTAITASLVASASVAKTASSSAAAISAKTGSYDALVGLPAVTAADNGKILMVVNGAWALVTPVSIYTGSAAPDNSQGINGDIYLQS